MSFNGIIRDFSDLAKVDNVFDTYEHYADNCAKSIESTTTQFAVETMNNDTNSDAGFGQGEIYLFVKLPKEPATIKMNLVLRLLKNNEYAVHYQNELTKGFFEGYYTPSLKQALICFQTRLQGRLDYANNRMNASGL